MAEKSIRFSEARMENAVHAVAEVGGNVGSADIVGVDCLHRI